MSGGRIAPLALVQLGLAVVLLGGSWPVTKLALLDGAAAPWFAFGRAALSLVVVTGVVAAARGVKRPRTVDMPAVLALGLLQVGGFFALAHAAAAWVPAGRTAILSNTTLVWTVPLALLTGEAIGLWRWMAAAVAMAGVVVLTGPWAIDWTSGPVLVGHGFLLGASLCWAVAMVVVRRWPPALSMFELLPWAFGLAAAMLLPLAWLHPAGVWTGRSLLCVGWIGLVMSPLGTWCVMQATLGLPLVVASVGFLAGPAIGLLLSAVWLGEAVTVPLVAGAGLLLGGAGLAAVSGRRA